MKKFNQVYRRIMESVKGVKFKNIEDFLNNEATKFKYDDYESEHSDTTDIDPSGDDPVNTYAYIDAHESYGSIKVDSTGATSDYRGIFIHELTTGQFSVYVEDPNNDNFFDKTLKNKQELVSFLKRNGASNLIKAIK